MIVALISALNIMNRLSRTTLQGAKEDDVSEILNAWSILLRLGVDELSLTSQSSQCFRLIVGLMSHCLYFPKSKLINVLITKTNMKVVILATLDHWIDILLSTCLHILCEMDAYSLYFTLDITIKVHFLNSHLLRLLTMIVILDAEIFFFILPGTKTYV